MSAHPARSEADRENGGPLKGKSDGTVRYPAGPALRQIREASRICCDCPAQAPCLAWALHHGVTDGVWGGTTEEQRRALRSLARPRPNGHLADPAGNPA